MELVHVPVRVPADTGHALRRLAREESGTAYMVLLAAYLVLLRGYTGEDDLVVGSYVAGRTRPETERLVGSLANTLALRFRVEDGATFRATRTSPSSAWWRSFSPRASPAGRR